MGTSLTGLEIKDTYEGLVKTTDNAPLTGSLKVLTDGLGNDSALALSTGAASVTGTLAVSGNATFDTNTLFVDAANNRVGVGLTAPKNPLHVNTSLQVGFVDAGNDAMVLSWGGASTNGTIQTFSSSVLALNPAGNNVGIGTSAPAGKLEVNGAMRSTRVGLASQYIEVDGGDAAGGFITMAGAAKTLIIRNNSTTASDVLFDQAVATRYTFAQAGTQILRIDADGVKFGADSAAANALDDYEEGTWTIGVSFDGASVGVTSSSNTGSYTKIGRQVAVNGVIVLTNKGSSTGAAAITGLPFTITNSNANYAGATMRLERITFANQFQGYGGIGSTTIELNEITEAGVVSTLTNADFANDSTIMLNFTYFV